MRDLTSGGNLPLPDGPVSVQVPGPFDISALITGDDGKVSGDGDFVFYNQPTAPGARLAPGGLALDPRRLRAGATRVTVVVTPAEPGAVLGGLPAPVLCVAADGRGALARFAPARPVHETVLLLAEIYRRGPQWKLRALGQGYADGLAGLVRDFGVAVAEGDAAPDADPATTALVNAVRSRAGAPPLTSDARLVAAARAHATAMAAQRRLDATGPDGASVFQRVTAGGYAYVRMAEHLVSGPRTVDAFLDYCLAEGRARTGHPAHDPAFTHVGIAHAVAASGDTYWTALWAAPLTDESLARTVAEVLALTNAERATAGLPPLAADARLAAAAQAYSTDMATRGFYSHTSPEGTEPWDRAAAAGAGHRGIGENIACGQRSPAEVVQGWMDSPGHRANILKPGFTHLGVGYAGGGPAGTYWTQLFGMA
ncbi:CAP domain-containing protein [Streptomyces hesseae]|uniref:CAP domain-containing protein n=1 Tax=Streptomyces hesseae TaxID=3075519 RepID=A0ABU2SIK5_9ACTN|nr:CAP domain-containing protein [Streptomyces sp. DSM 40473]MDT0447600.1 CAP domain-containing protein [Streptomyces sp. DSM 40473]